MAHKILLPTMLVLIAACGGAAGRAAHARESGPPAPALPWEVPSTQTTQVQSRLIALVGGRVMTATGVVYDSGTVVMEDGRVVAVGPASEVEVPSGAEVMDVAGKVVTPGIVDTHSHMGVYAQPRVNATRDGNEATAPVTAEVWAGDSVWPQDPTFARAVAGGVTTVQVLPGSANLIGGRGATLKLHLGRSVSEMLYPGAPGTLKMACGENPKRVYGNRNSAPSTRMGSVAGYRAAFQDAVEYGRAFRDWRHQHRLWQQKRIEWREAEQERRRAEESGDEPSGEDEEDPGPAPAPPDRDHALETLLGVVEGRVLVHMHCYRADEMARMIEVAREFGFSIRSFHHAVEAYKIRDVLAREQVSVSTWADWWGFKLEAFDAVPENLALLTEAGTRAIVHSDSAQGVQRLNQEAAKGMAAGRRAGVRITDDQALRWITANAAWALGIHEQTGTLEVGKTADVVVWSGSPFSVYTHADLVFIDGLLRHDRSRPSQTTDFEVGL